MPTSDTVFLIDVDNTLLDNDSVINDLRQHLIDTVGAERERRYWEIFEELRSELGYADYLGALQRYRIERPRDMNVLEVSMFLLHYPFADRLYPGALDAVAALKRRGPVVILSDGDIVFQPRKVERSGLWAAVDGQVLIYIHKEQMLDDVEQRYPAKRYVMVDDKLRILSAIKDVWHERVTTVFVKQGHYAMDPQILNEFPAADVSVDRIADLAHAANLTDMRIAALYDIHGNLAALEAVLRDVRRADVDRIVIGGDVLPGPQPVETLDLLLALDIPANFIVGNGDREVLAFALARGAETDWYRGAREEWRRPVRDNAHQLSERHLKAIASWPATLRARIDPLGTPKDVLFCHATPRSDTEIFTSRTPDDELRPIFAGCGAPIVVCGHTHVQFDRMVGDTRVVNAGSVGMSFGESGAFWLLVGPDVEFRRTMFAH